jgi:hypothetical protein
VSDESRPFEGMPRVRRDRDRLTSDALAFAFEVDSTAEGERYLNRVMGMGIGLRILTSQCEAFGVRLEQHVRFEEREWFPALEEHLGSDALASLAGALRTGPGGA